jgi:hypothetical protein
MKFKSLLYWLTSSLAVLLLSSSVSAQSFERTIYNGSGVSQDVVVADLNQDGKPDLLTTQQNDTGAIFLNLGNGTFPNGGVGINANGFPATRAVVADFTGDGITDIAVESCSSGGLTMIILSGDANHNFQATDFADRNFPPFASSCNDPIASLTLANQNLPSLVASSLDTSITIFLNDGTGHFTQQVRVFGDSGAILSGASVGDFNGDHLQDIAAVSTDPDGRTRHIVIFYQNSDGSFQPPVTVFSTDAILQIVQAVDFDGDDSNDLLVPFFGGSDGRSGVVALRNLGNGRFKSTRLLAGPFYVSAGQKAAVIQSQEKHGIHGILAPFSPAPLTGDPAIAFFPAHGKTWGKPVYFDIPNGQGVQAVAAGDFNNDGRPDFAAVDINNELLVFLNTTMDPAKQ